MDDFDEDILWEDDQGDIDDHESSPKRQRVEETTLLPVSALNGAAPEKKRPLREFMRELDVFTALSLARAGLVAGIKQVIALSEACNSQELQAILLSMCPERLCTENTKDYSTKLVTWFNSNFSHFDNDSITSDEGRDGSANAEDLLRILLNPYRKEGEMYRGSAIQLTQIFTALMRVNVFNCRFIMTVDTCSMNPADHKNILENMHRRRNKKAEFNFSTLRPDSDTSKVYLFHKEYRISPRFKTEIEPSAWCEICYEDEYDTPAYRAGAAAASRSGAAAISRATSSSSPHAATTPVKSNEVIDLLDSDDDTASKLPVKRPLHSPTSSTSERITPTPTPSKKSPPQKACTYPWTAADVINGSFGDTRAIEQKLGRHKPNKVFQYVFGVDQNGILVDVSYIYSSQSDKTMCIRHPEVEFLVNKHNNDLANSNFKLLGLIDTHRMQVMEFSKQFVAYDRVKVKETVPTSIDGFKKHPTYVLESQINTHQALIPAAKPLGKFKEQCYYRREDVKDLFTKSQWKSKYRKQVKDNELPVKEITRKEKVVGLFGPWQTEAYQREVVVDDIIPVNSFGNVEVFDGDERFLPVGTTLLTQNGVATVAKQLGLPCAQAIIGFSVNRGHSHPTAGGYVVLTKHVDLILDGLQTVLVDRNEKQEEKKQREIVTKWEDIVYRYIKFKELMSKY